MPLVWQGSYSLHTASWCRDGFPFLSCHPSWTTLQLLLSQSRPRLLCVGGSKILRAVCWTMLSHIYIVPLVCHLLLQHCHSSVRKTKIVKSKLQSIITKNVQTWPKMTKDIRGNKKQNKKYRWIRQNYDKSFGSNVVLWMAYDVHFVVHSKFSCQHLTYCGLTYNVIVSFEPTDNVFQLKIWIFIWIWGKINKMRSSFFFFLFFCTVSKDKT